MRTAFIVIGPESSCTRLVKHLLIDAGCYGDKTNQQRLDKAIPDNEKLMVFHQSIPHGNTYPNLEAIEKRFKRAGIETKWIVVLRDMVPTILSKVKRGHQPNSKNAFKALQEEIYYIFASMRIFKPDYYLVNASNIIFSLEGLEHFCGLELDIHTITNEDRKHYKNISALAW